MNKHRLALAGLVITIVLVAAAALAPLLSPHDPALLDLPGNLKGPSLSHPLGQDKLGRDILSRILYGARVSVKVGVATVSISLLVGLCVGSLAGYAGRWVDEVIMRIIDILMAFPGILLAIAITAVLGPSLNHVILALWLCPDHSRSDSLRAGTRIRPGGPGHRRRSCKDPGAPHSAEHPGAHHRGGHLRHGRRHPGGGGA